MIIGYIILFTLFGSCMATSFTQQYRKISLTDVVLPQPSKTTTGLTLMDCCRRCSFTTSCKYVRYEVTNQTCEEISTTLLRSESSYYSQVSVPPVQVYVKDTDSVYVLVRHLKTWSDAKTYCEGKGGQLMKIESAEEHNHFTSWLAASENETGICEDVHSTENCQLRYNAGECRTQTTFMSINCRHSCNLCDVDVQCEDKYNNTLQCQDWASYGECSNNPDWMGLYCRHSCNQCGQCWDRHTNTAECQYWASIGDCLSNPEWMTLNCRQTCNLCELGVAGTCTCSPWIGLNNLTGNGWEWADGSPLNGFMGWTDGQPDNLNGIEQCGRMRYPNMTWDDTSCTETRWSVCEY